MKKILIACCLCLALVGCGNDSGKAKTKKDTVTSLSEEMTTVQPTTTETVTEQVTTEQVTTEQVTTEQSTTTAPVKETTTVQATTEQKTTEQETTQSQEQMLENTFVDLGDSKLNSMCDEILVSILNNSMTEREKAYAIYTWVCGHVRYRGTTAIADWKESAKTILSTRKGNCYAFYVSSRALLARAGFETGMATSYELDHYWNLVKVDGQWRHFDTTSGWGTERFLWTGTQINEYSYYNSNLGTTITYDWNPEGCPDSN